MEDLEKGKDSHIYINSNYLKGVSKIQLDFGQQGEIDALPFKMDIGYGEASCLLFEIPSFKRDSLQIEIRSLIENYELFYPIIVKLNSDFELQEIIKSTIRIEGTDFIDLGDLRLISADKSTKYLLITTDSSLINRKFPYFYEMNNVNILPIYTGTDMIYNSTYSSSVIYNNITFSDKPRISIIVPTKMSKRPIRREDGIYFGLGTNFGGDKVLDNPGGDPYKAGGGAFICAGYSHPMHFLNFVGRYGIGYRYQGSKEGGNARNSGILSEAILVLQTNWINIGVGGQLDIANSVRDLKGQEVNFKTNLGPKFVLEYRYKGFGNLGLEYLLMDYSSTDNRKYNGNRIGVAMRFFFGI
jgi:hypothetical protein